MTTESEWIDFLEKLHAIKKAVWQKHGLQFDSTLLYIPYCLPSGTHLFTKTREEPSYEGENKYRYPKGSKVTLYPNTDLSKSDLWVMTEGELDMLTLESHIDTPAVTSGSVTSFKKEFASYFKGKDVYICYDNDTAGVQGAEDVGQKLLSAGAKVKIVNLPKEKGCKDIGDYFKLGHTKEDFKHLLETARKIVIDKSKTSWTETPHAIPKKKLLKRTLTYKEVEEKVNDFLPGSSIALKIVLAVAMSSTSKSNAMLWMLLVGVPSSGKTDIVRLLKDAPNTYYLDNLTQNAFISGERATKSNKVHDLLPLINKKCLIIKDWTSIFSLDEKMTKKLLGDLVGIYDKEFTKFSSRRGNISYESSFSQIGCITPATLNKHTQYMNMVGPRFLCYTMPTPSEEMKDISYKAIFSGTDRTAIETEARLYVSSYVSQLISKKVDIKPFNKSIEEYLRIAAGLMSNCRGIVIMQSTSFKNEEEKEIKYYEVVDKQIEEPWRAVQQLIKLAKYLSLVVEKDEVGIDELSIVKEVVISSMPADRSHALRMVKKLNGQITAKGLADFSDKSFKTSHRLLDELTGLKVLAKKSGSGTIANEYVLRDEFKDFILLDTAEFMSRKENGAIESNNHGQKENPKPTPEEIMENNIKTEKSWNEIEKEFPNAFSNQNPDGEEVKKHD